MTPKKICYYCGKPTNSLAGNPSEWGIPLCHSDEPGMVKYHHIGCVSKRLQEYEKLKERIDEGKIEMVIKLIIDKHTLKDHRFEGWVEFKGHPGIMIEEITKSICAYLRGE